jgi:hypothetical protein
MPLHRLAAALAAVALAGPAARAAPTAGKEDPCARLAAVDRWSGSFQLTFTHSDKLVPSGNAATLVGAWRFDASGQLDLAQAFDDGERRPHEWRGEELDFSLEARTEEGTEGEGGYRLVRDSQALDRNANAASLALDCSRGTYRLSVDVGEFAARTKLVASPQLAAFCEKAGAGDPNQDAGALAGQLLCAVVEGKRAEVEGRKSHLGLSATVRERPFTAGQASLSGSAQVETNLSDLHARPITARLSWSLAPSREPPLEVVVEPDAGYRRWKPEPATEEGKAGARLAVTATLRLKGRPKDDPGKKGMFEFLLEDVSEKPGACTNCDKAPDRPDLAIEQEENRDLDVAANRTAFSRELARSERVVITSYDGGAYGRLRVKCRVGGRTIVGELKEKPGVQDLLVPRDDDHNHVADGWDEEKGSFGQEGSWDEDLPAGQRRLGDGYGLYEEYRGFRTQAGYVRTDPRRKDLFLYDPDGLARSYFAPANPAGLDLRFVEPGQIRFSGLAEDPDNRWVNFSSAEEDRYARQYAMFVKAWVSEDGGHASDETLSRRVRAGQAGGEDPYAFTEQPLKRIYVVKISPRTVERAVKGLSQDRAQKTYAMEMESTVIHEMGHGMGIHHHWAGNVRPGDGETDEMVASGMPSCAMRYRSAGESAHPERMPRLDRYCRKGESWVAGSAAPDGALGAQPANDCFGQIDVKSDP